MGVFDKICAVLAIPVGVVFLVLGTVGFFAGSSAQFTLPPILGGLPFLLGWAMSVTLIRFWVKSGRWSRDEDSRRIILGPYPPGGASEAHRS